jgi:hypothetical protein
VVQTGPAENGLVRILAGVESKATVATSALGQLYDGAPVRTTASAAAAGGR